MAEPSLSTTALSNRALRALGHNTPLTSFDTDQGAPADACRASFWDAWLEELEAYPWNGATRRVSLAAHADAPPFEFQRQFALPADCLKVRHIWDATEWDRWRVEVYYPDGDPALATRVIVTDLPAPLRVIYTADCRDFTRMGPSFRAAFVLRLATHLAGPITRGALSSEAQDAYARNIHELRRVDAQESGPEHLPDGTWVMARGEAGYFIQTTRSAD